MLRSRTRSRTRYQGPGAWGNTLVAQVTRSEGKVACWQYQIASSLLPSTQTDRTSSRSSTNGFQRSCPSLVWSRSLHTLHLSSYSHLLSSSLSPVLAVFPCPPSWQPPNNNPPEERGRSIDDPQPTSLSVDRPFPINQLHSSDHPDPAC